MTAMTANTTKLARFRQLMDAKKLHEESTTPSPTTTSFEVTQSASAIVARPMASSSHKSSCGAKSWPTTNHEHRTDKSRGVSLDLNDELEQEYQQQQMKTPPISNNAPVKENRHPNNLTAMKQIMRRKQLANAARKELDESEPDEYENKANNDTVDGIVRNGPRAVATKAIMDANAVLNNNNNESLSSSNGESLSLDDKQDSSSENWAMLGNHLNETTLDHEDPSLEMDSELAISPSKWMNDVHSDSLSSGNCIGNCHLGFGSGSGDGASGISGVLSFLGESPLFDQTIEEENEVERNLTRSAEKVKRLEEHLLRSAGEGVLSPVQPPRHREGGNVVINEENSDMEEDGEGGDTTMGREKGVTFAIQDGWETPRGMSNYTYPKSPYVDNDNSDDSGMMMTPSKKKLSESMEAQVNPMNESVIVSDGSDDEASGGIMFGSPSPMKGIGSDDELDGGSENDFGTLESSEMEILRMGSKDSSEMGGKRHRSGGSKQTTPTRASLMERNHTLVKEVRFADQTCVQLSERKKYYKNQAGQNKTNLELANKENAALRSNYESSLQETAQLKVLVESLQAQKHQADLQVDAYRAQITDTEKTHRSSLKKMEKTYYSHLKNSEEQTTNLNERLYQSLADNTKLQSKLDEVHTKWESKLQSDAASQELISSLKERVITGDATASNADASTQAMQSRLTDLQEMCDQQTHQLQRERNEREMIEHDRDDLQSQCDDLHRQLTEWVQTSDTLGDVFFNDDGSRNEDFVEELKEYTPIKQLRLDSSRDSGNSARTPTSNLLARTLRSELKRRETVADKLENALMQVSSLKEKIADMKMDVEEAKADNALIEEDLDEKCMCIAELQEALGEKNDQIRRLSEEIEVLCQDDGGASCSAADDVESSRDESQSQGSKRETVSVLEERLDAVEETLEFTDEELVETNARLADSQELLNETAGKLERSEDALAEARDQVSDYEAQVDKLFNHLAEKEAEHTNLKKFSDFQTSTLERLKDEVSQSSTLNVELRTQLKSCFQSLVSLEKILRTYEDLDGLAGRMMTEQSRKVSRLLETMEQFVQERSVPTSRDLESGESAPEPPSMSASSSSPESDMSSFYEERLDELREERNDANERSDELREEVANIESERDDANVRLDELREKVAAIKSERDDANEQLQKAQSFLQEFRDELSKQESEHGQAAAFLRKQCGELEAKLSTATSDLKSFQKENQSLSKAASTAENEVSQQMSVLRSNNSDLIKENETLRVSLQSFELQLEDERALFRAIREEADGYRHDVSNAKAAFQCLTTECDLTKASLSKVENEAQGLREVVSQKEKELKDCLDSLSSAQATFQEQNESLKSRCDDLDARLSVEEKGRLNVEASLGDASKHIATLDDAMKAKVGECQEKQNECQELIIHVKQIQSALGEAEKERSEAAGTIERLESEIQEKKSILFAYEESIISYKGDIRRLDGELQSTVTEKNSRILMLEHASNSRMTLFTEQLDRAQVERDASKAELSEMIERLQEELQASNSLHRASGERAKLAIKELEEELLDQNEAQKALEEEIIHRQASLEEETEKYHGASGELEEAQNEIARMTDRLDSLEMDRERMTTKHQDDMEELMDERNYIEGEKRQLEEQMHLLQSNIEEVDELNSQQGNEIAQLSAQNASMQKKCNIFKEKVKSLNEKNKAWEASYKAQDDDLLRYGMEISRLNGQNSDLKRVLLSQDGSGRYMNNELSLQTPQSGTQHYLGRPGTM